MSWIPCSLCRQIPCCCQTFQPQWPIGPSLPMPTVQQYHFTPTTPHLSDDDVKRIAREQAEYLKIAGLVVKALPASAAADDEAEKALVEIAKKRRPRKLTKR